MAARQVLPRGGAVALAVLVVTIGVGFVDVARETEELTARVDSLSAHVVEAQREVHEIEVKNKEIRQNIDYALVLASQTTSTLVAATKPPPPPREETREEAERACVRDCYKARSVECERRCSDPLFLYTQRRYGIPF